MSDALFNGRSFRLLTVVDCHTRESLAIVPRTNFKTFRVVDVLDRLVKELGVDMAPRLRVLKTPEPPARKAGVKIKSVSELVGQLQWGPGPESAGTVGEAAL